MNKAFTLVELIIVITILSILATTIVVNLNKDDKQIENNLLTNDEKKCFNKCEMLNIYIWECKKNCLFPTLEIWK